MFLERGSTWSNIKWQPSLGPKFQVFHIGTSKKCYPFFTKALSQNPISNPRCFWTNAVNQHASHLLEELRWGNEIVNNAKDCKRLSRLKKIKEENKSLLWRRIQTTRIRRQMDRKNEMKKERDVEEREENGAQIDDN